MKRKYQKLTKQQKLDTLNDEISRLDKAAAKRMQKIERLRTKAQEIEAKLTPAVPEPVAPAPEHA